MRIRNNNPLDLSGVNAENITVSVRANNQTIFGVTFDLDGAKGVLPQPFNFTLSKPAQAPFVSVLTLFFVFSSGGGGAYELVVSGSQGGDTSHFTVSQFEDMAADSIAYTFDIT